MHKIINTLSNLHIWGTGIYHQHPSTRLFNAWLVDRHHGGHLHSQRLRHSWRPPLCLRAAVHGWPRAPAVSRGVALALWSCHWKASWQVIWHPYFHIFSSYFWRTFLGCMWPKCLLPLENVWMSRFSQIWMLRTFNGLVAGKHESRFQGLQDAPDVDRPLGSPVSASQRRHYVRGHTLRQSLPSWPAIQGTPLKMIQTDQPIQEL